MKKTILIGCGNIGFRHLQALCAMAMASETDLTIVEPNLQNRSRITDELARANVGQYRVQLSLPEAPSEFDLVIIATNADVRAQVFHDLADRHLFKAIIFEKVLFQRISDIDAVSARLRGVAAYVNCGRRGFPGYQMLRERLVGPLDFVVEGTQFALASNAIHFLDIAAYLNNSPLTSLDAGELDKEAVASKRSGNIEIYGTLRGQLANGAHVRLTCAPAETLELNIALTGGQIDEGGGTATINGDEVPFETRHVSGMPYLYETLLRGEGCILPTYAESAEQHRLLLGAINGHLGLSGHPNTLCPIS